MNRTFLMHLKKTFFIFVILGILISFAYKKIPKPIIKKNIIIGQSKQNIKKGFLKSHNTDTTKSRALKRNFLNNDLAYVQSITKRNKHTKSLNKFIQKEISSETKDRIAKNKALEPFTDFYPPRKSETGGAAGIDKCPRPCPPCPTGRAAPLVYTRPPIFLFPPPVFVVSSTTPAPPPPPVPIPELSSVLLTLTGLSGMLGFKKKLY